VARRVWKSLSARRWPESPHAFIEATVVPADHPTYVVSVVFAPADDGTLEAMMISVAKQDGEEISVRQIQRMPLSSLVGAAHAFVSDPKLQQAVKVGGKNLSIDARKLDRVYVPSRKSPLFYERIAETSRGLKADGKKPAIEIARTMKAPRNRVDQWLHQARKRGFDCG